MVLVEMNSLVVVVVAADRFAVVRVVERTKPVEQMAVAVVVDHPKYFFHLDL